MSHDMLYLTDDLGHAVRKCTTDGKVALTIGTPKKPAPAFSGDPFNRCTHTALSPQGDIYVSDGYANARVHKYSPDGKLLFSWGEPGTDPGQFNLVHNIACDDEGWVYIADRENHRVQVFDSNGKYETQWHNLMRPCGLFVTRGREPIAVIGELGPETVASLTKGVPNLGPRLSVVSGRGETLAHLGTEPIGEGLGQFIAPHGIALDSRGDIYVAEVANILASPLWDEARSRVAFAAKAGARELMFPAGPPQLSRTHPGSIRQRCCFPKSRMIATSGLSYHS